MALDLRPAAGALYRIGQDFAVERMVAATTVANGLGWSPGGSVMYFIDSLEYGVDVFDYDASSGEIANRRRCITIDPEDGVPDGMTVDANGDIWVALFGGGAVRRYGATGALAEEIALPASQVTSCAFGGPALDELYVTTAVTGLSPEQHAAQPAAGKLLRCDVGVHGLLATRFSG